MKELEQIARTCHAAHNALIGSDDPWEMRTSEHKNTVFDSIEKIISGELTSPKEAHNNFVERKKAAGWEYGPEYSFTNKTNPRLVEYEDLGLVGMLKERVFFNIVKSFEKPAHRV